MADTIRPRDSLTTILADNTTKQISPQDVRDFLISTPLRGTTTAEAVYSETTTASRIEVGTLSVGSIPPNTITSPSYTFANVFSSPPYVTAQLQLSSINTHVFCGTLSIGVSAVKFQVYNHNATQSSPTTIITVFAVGN